MSSTVRRTAATTTGSEASAAPRSSGSQRPIRVGSQVPVHYNPEVPARSVVEVGDLSRNTKTGLVVAPVMLLVSLYLFWHLRYRTWPRTS